LIFTLDPHTDDFDNLIMEKIMPSISGFFLELFKASSS
jgi:hypothetical protein